MIDLAILAYCIPGILFILALVSSGKNKFLGNDLVLNAISIVHAFYLLGLTVIILSTAELPVYYLNGRYFAIDRLAIYEILIATTIFSLSAIYARGYVRDLLKKGKIESSNTRLFYGAFNLLFTVIVLSFLSNNIALYWIFLELTTLFSALLIVILKAKENIIASLKYIFIASSAMLFSFIGIIILFALSRDIISDGMLNWDTLLAVAPSLSGTAFGIAFILLFIGFGAKSGLVPFHTWLPTAHSSAPSVVSALLSGVLLNIGIYGILRLNSIAIQTTVADNLKVFLIIAGLISIVIPAFCLATRTNTKKFIAFSSIEHMGLLVLGIGLSSPLVIFWVLFHKFGHSLSKTLLFFSAGIFHQQYESNKYFQIKNAFKMQPLASWGLILGSLSVLGMPLFPIFLSKLNILTGLADYSVTLLIVVLLLLFLIASSFGYYMVRAFNQKEDEMQLKRYETPASMSWPIVLIIIILLVLGLYIPSGLTELFNGIIADLGF
ncbi:MAG TPA: hydrogenase membrane subunit [Dehalococcoidia bacterium]|nr:hydrogenase membrane subunit [Dehalococcoidia bacterium]HAS28246.1 hydrogenase membrane subunit [Dehalococcoidia bacterium]